MIPVRAAALPGVELTAGDGDAVISGVAIDSRLVVAGDLFVAIRGGHAHLAEAVARGAAAILVERDRPAELPAAPCILTAADSVAALQAIGAANRAAARACRVIGITGSSGKTSTKDALAALLGEARSVVAADGGQNNEIGLPLTLTRIGPGSEAAVCELAMRGPDQIAELCALARPDIGVITNVGTAHIELLGSRAAIARAKAELAEALPAGGGLVLPADEPLLDPWRALEGIRTLTFGEEPGADVRIVDREPGDGSQQRFGLVVEGRRVAVTTPLQGRHQALNIASAVAACLLVGVEPEQVVAGAERIGLSAWRGQSLPLAGGGVVVNDAYNANPASLLAALEAFVERPCAGRRIAVLGEMAELGPEAPRYHREAGEAAAALGIDAIVAVGEPARGYLEGAGPTVEGRFAGSREELGPVLAALVAPGDAVLVKGSRAAGLEQVAAGLAARLPKEHRS